MVVTVAGTHLPQSIVVWAVVTQRGHSTTREYGSFKTGATTSPLSSMIQNSLSVQRTDDSLDQLLYGVREGCSRSTL